MLPEITVSVWQTVAEPPSPQAGHLPRDL